MLTYPAIDPVAIAIGPVSVHWYGLMYVVALMAAWALGVYRAGRPGAPLSKAQIEDLIFYGAVGVILGGRFGYVFFYNFGAFLENPLWLFKVWEGGMSFHGGLLGVVVALLVYSRKIKKPFLTVMDFAAPLVPIGLGFGRVGNFIGQELWGRATDPTAPWAMVFPKDPEALARHPSQLYQAFLEGIVLFSIVFWFSRKPRPRAAVSSLFLIIYGMARFIVEFVREPDSHLKADLLFDWMTRGQLLSLPMIGLGLAIFVYVMFFQRVESDAYTEKNKKAT